MNILTDEEMKQIHADTFGKGVQSFARAIEAAVLSKLAEQAIEPTGYWYSDDPAVCAYPGSGYFPGEVPPNDAINIVPLFSEVSLAAAQQRTAEACAKAVSAEYLTDPHDATDGAYNLALDHAIGGMKRWREYL